MIDISDIPFEWWSIIALTSFGLLYLVVQVVIRRKIPPEGLLYVILTLLCMVLLNLFADIFENLISKYTFAVIVILIPASLICLILLFIFKRQISKFKDRDAKEKTEKREYFLASQKKYCEAERELNEVQKKIEDKPGVDKLLNELRKVDQEFKNAKEELIEACEEYKPLA